MRPAHLTFLCILVLAGVAVLLAGSAWAGTNTRVPTTGAPHAATEDPVQQAAVAAVRKLDLQLTLPHTPSDGDEREAWRMPHLPQQVVWIAAVGFGLILAYIAQEMMPGWRRGDDEGWGITGIGMLPTGQSAGSSLAIADALSADGRFVEAMHVLLLHCLDEMKRRLKLDIADSLTSREIVRRASLPEAATRALRGIVARVESSYFGDHPATRSDYDSCRGRYEELVAILSGTPHPRAEPAA